MAVLCEAISVIVPRDVLDAKHPGGVARYQRDCPDQTFCMDEDLTRVGFMTPADVQVWAERLIDIGLVPLQNGEFEDLAVIDQESGPTRPSRWLSFGQSFKGFSFCSLSGTPAGRVAAPATWDPGGAPLVFAPLDEVKEGLTLVGRSGNQDMYRDERTGRVTYVGRPFEAPVARGATPPSDAKDRITGLAKRVVQSRAPSHRPPIRGRNSGSARLSSAGRTGPA